MDKNLALRQSATLDTSPMPTTSKSRNFFKFAIKTLFFAHSDLKKVNITDYFLVVFTQQLKRNKNIFNEDGDGTSVRRNVNQLCVAVYVKSLVLDGNEAYPGIFGISVQF